MTDIQHNISDDHIIKNTTDIGNDYKFANHNVSPSRDQPAGMMLFRLLVPGPSNLRGRTEAYQVSISTGRSTGPASNVAAGGVPTLAISQLVSSIEANIPILEEFKHIEGPPGGPGGIDASEQPSIAVLPTGKVAMGAAAAGDMDSDFGAPDFGPGSSGL